MKRFNKILVVFTLFLLFTVVFAFVCFSEVLQFVVRDQTALKKRNFVRKFYLKTPLLDFRVYFFNISNPTEVQEGQIPVVKEVGPYCYDAYKEKIDVLENTGEDSLTYTPYDTYFFNQERSGRLTADDYVTILHPLIVGIVNSVAPPLFPVVNKALKSIFHDPQNIYFTTKVKDILFDGITIDCNVHDFAGKAVCTQLKGQIPDLLLEVEKNVYKFSVLGPRNGTSPNRLKVLRGIKKSHELGRLVELNHQKESTSWRSKECNRYKGTDGWIFPPFTQKELGIWTYSTDVCRNIHLIYEEDSSYQGIFAEKYFGDLGDMAHNPADKCYCPSAKKCLPKGVLDMTKCMGVPIYATLPHFLRVDKEVQHKIQGLNPVTEDHIIKLLIQPLLGIPLVGKRRMQFNLPIQSIKKISIMKTLPQSLHPIFWVEEGIELKGPAFKLVKSAFVGLRIFDVVNYCLVAICVGGIGYGGYLRHRERNSAKVVPVRCSADISKRSSTVTKEIPLLDNNIDQVNKF